MEIHINDVELDINDLVHVVLTDDGVAQHTAWYADIGFNEAYALEALTKHSVGSNGEYEFHLWQLMTTFGPAMSNGNPKQMFKKNRVSVIVPNLH